jgi:hypothetical protein
MTVHIASPALILLEGTCPSEDSETLLQALLEHPGAVVDWTACDSAHTAVIQVLVAFKPKLTGPPAGNVLRQWVAPAMMAVSAT